MLTILGIDPALNHVGYGIIFYDEMIGKIVQIIYGMYEINPKDSVEMRLNTTFLSTQHLLDTYQIDEVGLEKAYHNPRTANGGFLVREAIGALKVAIVQKGKPIHYYTPQRIKKDVTGSGSAEKQAVAEGIASLLGLKYFEVTKKVRKQVVVMRIGPEELVKKHLDHIADALSIAYCRLLEIDDTLKKGGEVHVAIQA